MLLFTTDKQFYACLCFGFTFIKDGIVSSCNLSKIFPWLLSWQKTESSVFKLKSWTSWTVPINSALFVSTKAKNFLFMLCALHIFLPRLLTIVQNWLFFWWLAPFYQCFTEVFPSPMPWHWCPSDPVQQSMIQHFQESVIWLRLGVLWFCWGVTGWFLLLLGWWAELHLQN